MRPKGQNIQGRRRGAVSGKQSVEPSGDLLEVSGLAVEAGGRTILHPTDLNLGAGEWKAIVGPNGAGKSTLLKALATLVPYRGSIRYRGRPISEDPLGYRSELGVVLHEPLLYRELSAWENLLFYARLYGVAEPRASAQRALAEVGLSVYAQEPVGRFSRGMIQRLALARAMLHQPRLLLLDEPLSGIDARGEEEILRLFRRAKEAQVAALWVTHRWRVAWEIVDEIVELERGAVRRITRTAEADRESWEPSYLEEEAR